MEETRAERSARRRKEVLTDLHNKFREYCDEELKNLNITPSDRLRNAIRKQDEYINRLVIAKPQEKSFYLSVAFEWQRIKLAQMEEIQRKR